MLLLKTNAKTKYKIRKKIKKYVGLGSYNFYFLHWMAKKRLSLRTQLWD